MVRKTHPTLVSAVSLFPLTPYSLAPIAFANNFFQLPVSKSP